MGIGPPFCRACTTPEELRAEKEKAQRSEQMRKLIEGFSALGVEFTPNYSEQTVAVSQEVYDFLGPRPRLVVDPDL